MHFPLCKDPGAEQESAGEFFLYLLWLGNTLIPQEELTSVVKNGGVCASPGLPQPDYRQVAKDGWMNG